MVELNGENLTAWQEKEDTKNDSSYIVLFYKKNNKSLSDHRCLSSIICIYIIHK